MHKKLVRYMSKYIIIIIIYYSDLIVCLKFVIHHTFKIYVKPKKKCMSVELLSRHLNLVYIYIYKINNILQSKTKSNKYTLLKI